MIDPDSYWHNEYDEPSRLRMAMRPRHWSNNDGPRHHVGRGVGRTRTNPCWRNEGRKVRKRHDPNPSRRFSIACMAVELSAEYFREQENTHIARERFAYIKANWGLIYSDLIRQHNVNGARLHKRRAELIRRYAQGAAELARLQETDRPQYRLTA